MLPKIHLTLPEIQSCIFHFTEEAPKERIARLLGCVRLDHLSTTEKSRLQKLISELATLFFLKGDKLESKILTPHEFRTLSENQPVYTKTYGFPEIFTSEVERQTKDLIEQKIIQPSNLPWNSPLWTVPKKISVGRCIDVNIDISIFLKYRQHQCILKGTSVFFQYFLAIISNSSVKIS